MASPDNESSKQDSSARMATPDHESPKQDAPPSQSGARSPAEASSRQSSKKSCPPQTLGKKKRVSWLSNVAQYPSSNNSDTFHSVHDEEDEVEQAELLNSVGLAVTTQRSLQTHASLETCLLTAGIQVEHSTCVGPGAFLQRGVAGNLGGRKRRAERLDDGRSATPTKVLVQASRSTSSLSAGRTDSTGSTVGEGWDRDLLWRFFTDGSTTYVRMSHTHTALDSIVRHVITGDEEPQPTADEGEESTRSQSSLMTMLSVLVQAKPRSRLTCRCAAIRRAVSRLVESNLFKAFFLILTVYTLFGPDCALYWGNVETDKVLLYVNTTVFMLFIAEFLLLAVGQSWYVLSLVALLDLVALLSMVGDTWFLAYDSAMFSEEGAKLSRVARSSRVTRLVRLAKIARAGRLLPRLLRLVWRQQMALARTIMLKKVWRVFLFLDSDGDGLVSMLDLKVFYFSILQECEHMLSASRQALLCMDVGIFESEEAAKLKREGSSCDFLFTFQEFSRIFLSTRSGKDMLKHYTRDIEQATTVWAVTNKLSDTLALKTCLLVLLLVVAMSAFEIDAEDRSPEQGLAQLDRLARTEHSHNQTGGAYLCSQIAVYRLRHEVLLLFLAGKTYFESGTCSPSGVPPAELDPFARAETLVVNMGLRASEVLQACTPSSVACSRSTSTGMVLLDLTAQAREESLFALLTMVAVVSLLIIFVLVLKVKIQKFTGMLVNPLRSVADDMVAMSSLEILTSNGDGLDSPFPESRSNIFELQLLQEALQSMRMTIRSWSLYVPPCVVQRLFSKGIEATIGVAKCTVSVLFCDIDGFEDTCADLSPQEVLSLLSLVLGKIADVIEERQGTVLEFIGDEVLAVFNTPEFVKHHVYSAVASALEIHRVLDGLPKMITDSGKEITVRCRCGVNTGSIFAGNIGSKNRMKYGLLGDGVNLAARLKTLNSLYGTRTLVSAAVIEDRAAGRLFVHRPVDAVAVKGKKQPTVVFEVLDGVHTARDLLRKAAAKHREGFTLYRERQFEEASRVFSQAASLFAAGGYKEHVSPVLRRRCNALIEKPPPEDWDGVERLTRKNWEEVVDDSEGAKQLVDIRPDGTWRQDSTLITLEALDALEPLETPKASLVHKCTPQVLSF